MPGRDQNRCIMAFYLWCIATNKVFVYLIYILVALFYQSTGHFKKNVKYNTKCIKQK